VALRYLSQLIGAIA